MLISAEELAARLDDPTLRLADVRWYVGEPGRGRREYDEGHLPGAVFVDLDRDLAGPSGPGRHPLPDPLAFAARMGELGIGRDSFVVAYDDSLGTVAARLWWMLDNLGHDRVALLDGGLKAWRAAGLPLSTERVTLPAVEPLAPSRAWSGVIDRPALIERLREVALLDARAPERYRGETEPVDPRPGHIPSAISAPARISLGSNGRFLQPTELAERLGTVASPERRRSADRATEALLRRRVKTTTPPSMTGASCRRWLRPRGPGGLVEERLQEGDDPGDRLG